MAGAMEYDPSLRETAKHRDFLFRRANQRRLSCLGEQSWAWEGPATLLFRLRYLRDSMIRPMLDETGLSALQSLMQFTTADICGKVFQHVSFLSSVLTALQNTYGSEDGTPEGCGTVSPASTVNSTDVPVSMSASQPTIRTREIAVEPLCEGGIGTDPCDDKDAQFGPQPAGAVASALSVRSETLGFLRELFFLSRSIPVDRRQVL